MRLEEQIDQIRADIAEGRYTTAARDSAGVIELAHREIFRRILPAVSGDVRHRIVLAEQRIGNGNKSVEQFGLGELVGLFREAQLFSAYSDATGVQLRAITMINFRQVVDLRNRLQHHGVEATRGEAQLFLQCVENMLEAFGILTLDPVVETESDREETQGDSTRRDTDTAPRRASTYRLGEDGESVRLSDQGELTRSFDLELFAAALEGAQTPLIGLDIGSADALVTEDRYGHFKDSFSQIIAIDRDPDCIQSIKQRSSIEAHQLDIESVGACDRLSELLSADQPVLASLLVVVHHLAAPIRVLKSLRAVLPAGSRVVIRTIDEGTHLPYPDQEGRVSRVIGQGVAFADGTDRFHGRKLYGQLWRAGYRDIRILLRPYILSNMDSDQRDLLFRVEYGFRENLLKRGFGGSSPTAQEELVRDLRSDLAEIELDFEDPAYFYTMSWFGAVAYL